MDTCKAIRDIRQEGYDEGVLMMLGGLVCEGILTVEDASRRARLTPEEFEEKAAACREK